MLNGWVPDAGVRSSQWPFGGAMATVTVSFTLDDDADRDLLQWLACQPRRQKSAAIRESLRSCLNPQGVTLREIYGAVRDVVEKYSLDKNTS